MLQLVLCIWTIYTTPAVDTTTNTTTVTADEPPSKKPRTFKRKPAADATPAN